MPKKVKQTQHPYSRGRQCGMLPGFRGNLYQVSVLAHYVFKSILDDAISTKFFSEDDPRYGKFDDVIIEYSDHILAIQLKHYKEGITVGKLTSRGKNAPFALYRYFVSWMEKKEAHAEYGKPVHYILGSNAWPEQWDACLTKVAGDRYKFSTKFICGKSDSEEDDDGSDGIESLRDNIFKHITEKFAELKKKEYLPPGEMNGHIREFLGVLEFRFEGKILQQIEGKLEQKMGEHFHTINPAIYHAFMAKIRDWTFDDHDTGYSATDAKRFLDNARLQMISLERCYGISSDYLKNIVFEIAGFSFPRDTEINSITDFMTNQAQNFLVISGQSGIGKSVVVKKFLHHWNEYREGECLFLHARHLLNKEMA